MNPFTQSGSGGGSSSSGDVTGPSSSTDNTIARFDSTTGKIIQGSLATVDDNGTVNIPTGQTFNINGSAHVHLDYITADEALELAMVLGG